MHIPGIAGRSVRKAPLIEFYAMSLLQGRRVGRALYDKPSATGVSLSQLIAKAHAAASECLLEVEGGAPELPDTALDSNQLSRLCCACIDAMLAQSRTGRLAHQEREWLFQVFNDSMPAVSDEELERAASSMSNCPPGHIQNEQTVRRYTYEIAKAVPGVSKLKGGSGLAVLVWRQEGVKGALQRALEAPTLRSFPKVKVQSSARP